MVIDERETTNGHGCSIGPTTDKCGLSSFEGGVSCGDGTSSEGLRMYKRRKRKSDEKAKTIFNDKIKLKADEDGGRLSFNIRAGECSLRHCRKVVLQQMYQSLSGCEDGISHCIQNALVTTPQIATSEDVDSCASAKQISHFGLLNQSEDTTISDLCGRAFLDTLMSDKFTELCGLLLKNFGAVNVNRILDVNAINMRMKNGAYETSPMLYLKDIQQVWTKLQQVGNEMVMLANCLSDKSRDHYEQFVRKAKSAEEFSNCHGCGEKADVGNCLVCDSCEEIYHLSCTEIFGTDIPPKSWYCSSCVSNGIGSPHDNCIVCEKLNAAASSFLPLVPLNDDDVGLEKSHEDSKICFVCKIEVKQEDNFRTCGHMLCGHKFYHCRCLTNKQLGVYGPSWFCPSCLCRGCLLDKDDEKIVLCDGCDQAYHIYCMSPQLNSIPQGNWYCVKCDRDLKRIETMKAAYENIQKRVKIEKKDALVLVAVEDEDDDEEKDKSGGGLEMLVTAAKTLSHQESIDLGGI